MTELHRAREERFVALVGEIGETLHRYAVRRIDPTLAEDVVADALLVVWRRLDDVPHDDPVPWCIGVARNCLANVQRGRRRQARVAARLAAEPDPAPVETDHGLTDALERMSAEEQELLRLWAWEDLTPTQIAVVLGISVNAANLRLHRARKRLGELLGKSTAPAGHGTVKEGDSDGR